MKAIDNLNAITKLYKQRNELYRDNYKIAGIIFQQLFKSGVEINTVEDYNRFAVLMQIINKLIRYSFNWDTGHPDSLNDMAVYSMILKELDDEYLEESDK